MSRRSEKDSHADLLRPGDRLGGFTVLGSLGRGAMGTVYRARQDGLDRTVALKLMHGDHGYNAESLARFQREARLLASLSHPNVVAGISAGEERGRPWLAMEFVDGENLEGRLARLKQIPEDEVLRIASAVGSALAFAERHGVIHRDLKPANILLGQDGGIKLSDLGLARRQAQEDARLTQTGIVVGTPAYMSPEQVVGREELDGRSDLYSLGVCLYQALAGQLPFSARDSIGMMAQHLNDRPLPLRRVRSGLRSGTYALIDRLLAKKKSDRFTSGAALQQECEALLAEPPYEETVHVARKTAESLRHSAESRRDNSLLLWTGLGAGAALLIGLWIARRDAGLAPDRALASSANENRVEKAPPSPPPAPANPAPAASTPAHAEVPDSTKDGAAEQLPAVPEASTSEQPASASTDPPQVSGLTPSLPPTANGAASTPPAAPKKKPTHRPKPAIAAIPPSTAGSTPQKSENPLLASSLAPSVRDPQPAPPDPAAEARTRNDPQQDLLKLLETRYAAFVGARPALSKTSGLKLGLAITMRDPKVVIEAGRAVSLDGLNWFDRIDLSMHAALLYASRVLPPGNTDWLVAMDNLDGNRSQFARRMNDGSASIQHTADLAWEEYRKQGARADLLCAYCELFRWPRPPQFELLEETPKRLYDPFRGWVLLELLKNRHPKCPWVQSGEADWRQVEFLPALGMGIPGTTALNEFCAKFPNHPAVLDGSTELTRVLLYLQSPQADSARFAESALRKLRDEHPQHWASKIEPDGNTNWVIRELKERIDALIPARKGRP